MTRSFTIARFSGTYFIAFRPQQVILCVLSWKSRKFVQEENCCAIRRKLCCIENFLFGLIFKTWVTSSQNCYINDDYTWPRPWPVALWLRKNRETIGERSNNCFKLDIWFVCFSIVIWGHSKMHLSAKNCTLPEDFLLCLKNCLLFKIRR